MTTTTAPPAGQAPSWFDRHIQETTTGPARPTTEAPTPTRGSPTPTEEDDDGEEG